jgi:hypothetical protein
MRRLAFLSLACAGLFAQTQSVDVAPGDWVDSSVDVRAGDVVVITAGGTLTVAQGRSVGPAGQGRGFRDLIKSYPLNDAGLGALIGRIGSSDAAVPFLVGEAKRLEAPRAGRLFLSINKTGNDTVNGAFHVTIQFLSRGSETPRSLDGVKLPDVTLETIDRLPRRVTDAQGNPGDNTNFVIAGPGTSVIAAFEAAGWVKVDKTKKEAVLQGLLESLSKQSYLELPMSELTLFGRSQDYGLAHAEPLTVAEQRHHLRLWKAPFAVDGQELWVGAATHDIGFDRDNRNNGITHKIDPNIDDERDFISRSLEETGRVAKISYLTPAHPSKEARTATGATFHSDGRVLVIQLWPDSGASQP